MTSPFLRCVYRQILDLENEQFYWCKILEKPSKNNPIFLIKIETKNIELFVALDFSGDFYPFKPPKINLLVSDYEIYHPNISFSGKCKMLTEKNWCPAIPIRHIIMYLSILFDGCDEQCILNREAHNTYKNFGEKGLLIIGNFIRKNKIVFDIFLEEYCLLFKIFLVNKCDCSNIRKYMWSIYQKIK